MRYKILVTGKSALVKDFMKHTGKYFFTLSTTSYINDVANHFKVFEPDAYVSFIDTNDGETIASISGMKDFPSYNSTPIFIVGNLETCTNIQKANPYLADLFIKRPISADNLALRITRYLEEAEEAKAEKENAAAQQQPEAKSSETSDTVPKSESDNKKHILIVDDDRSFLKMLKSALEENYHITTMANGILVEKFLDTKEVDMILLDHEMPIETGAQVFKKLKDHPKGKHIPVCFLTGVAERSQIEEIMMLKPHGYLLKPIDMDLLKATISNLIN